MEHIEYAPEVVKGLWRLFIFHSKNKVKECLVIHFAFKGLKLLKHSVDKDSCQTRRIAGQFCLVKHSILVLVKFEILIVDAQR